MNIKRAAAIALRQFYLLRGSPVRILPMFAWVAIDIVLWGFITRYLNTVATAGFNFVPALLGAVLLWDFLVRVMQGVTTAFFEDVWSRNFLNIFATPLSISEYITGLVLASIATSTFGLVVMIVLATLVFGLSFFVYGALLIPFFLVLFLFGIALGIFGCALVLRMGPAAEWIIWPIPALLSPLACVFYPLSALPRWLQYPARLLPPSHVFEAMRSIVAGRAVAPGAMLSGIGLAVFYLALAGFFFTRIFKYVVRSGLIARYSAESVS
jgi:ABC-2 type transport system permease protein